MLIFMDMFTSVQAPKLVFFEGLRASGPPKLLLSEVYIAVNIIVNMAVSIAFWCKYSCKYNCKYSCKYGCKYSFLA